MRFLYAKFVGYIGFYNGSGLTELEIDFTKCRNNIVVISGPNGVGKSTLLNALSVIPDGNDCFVPSMPAAKYLRILDNGDVYDIAITHPLDKHNNRATSKATIRKNGLELNPNGNISSYKDIVFSEFDLDSNYLTLCKLSGEDRGLADKRPADRKKFVSSISASLDTYNGINKNLTKKANIYKSYVNNLSSKIQNIGEESYLRTTLGSLSVREDAIERRIDDKKAEVAKLEAILAMNEVDQSLQEEYKDVESRLNTVTAITNNLEKDVLAYKKNIIEKDFQIEIIDENVESIINSMEEDIKVHEMKKVENTSNMSNQLSQITNINTDIEKLEVKINGLKSDLNLELENTIRTYKNNIKAYEDSFNKLEIKDLDNISPEEIKHIISIITEIVTIIDEYYSNADDDIVKTLRKFHYSTSELRKELSDIIRNKEAAEQALQTIREKGIELSSDLKMISILDNKPEDCINNSCPFISESIYLLESKYGSIEKFNERQSLNDQMIESAIKKIDKLNRQMSLYEKAISQTLYLDRVTSTIDSNLSLLTKLGITTGVTDKNRLYEHIDQGYRFNSLRNLNEFYDLSNNLIEYKSDKAVLNKLESEYAIQLNNQKVLDSYIKELNDKITERDNVNGVYDALRKDSEFLVELISSLKVKRDKLTKYKELITTYTESIELQKTWVEKFNKIQFKMQSSSDILIKVSDINALLISAQNELKPIKTQKREIENQIMMLESYQREYAMYREKYDMIDKLKKYSSPTAGGIQTLFMSIYMSKTLDLANQLLGMIFGGQYQLLDYIINENEFRMPFVGSGLVVDDISSGSTSQVCIMGMIINLVLRNQASTKYNITLLDEIDGGLDHNNRMLFVYILQQIVRILNIEQLFIISHSVESALNDVDVILLSNAPDYADLFSGANIIYRPLH